MLTFTNITLMAATLAVALVAGLFYGYSCSVNPGLGHLSDTAYLSAMQSINRAILNPLFFITFMGSLILLPLSTWQHYGQPLSTRFWCLLSATLLYYIAVFGVTMVRNVPMNEALDAFNISTASAAEMADRRAAFEGPWNFFHSIRTITSVLATLLMIIACLVPRSTN